MNAVKIRVNAFPFSGSRILLQGKCNRAVHSVCLFSTINEEKEKKKKTPHDASSE